MIFVYTVYSSNSSPVEIQVGSIYSCNCLDCRFKGFDELNHLNASNTYATHINIEAKASEVKPKELVRVVQKKDGAWGIAYFEK